MRRLGQAAPHSAMPSCRRPPKEDVHHTMIGVGVIVLTDMFGGTPSNLAISVMAETGAEVLAGINLPMLIKLASVRGEGTLAAAVNAAKEAGRKYISVASQVLSGEA
jgi:PTS system mannose-specific IIA component